MLVGLGVIIGETALMCNLITAPAQMHTHLITILIAPLHTVIVTGIIVLTTSPLALIRLAGIPPPIMITTIATDSPCMTGAINPSV